MLCSNLKTYILNIFFYFYHHLQFNLNKNTVVWGHICVGYLISPLCWASTQTSERNHCKRHSIFISSLHQSLYNNSTNNLLNEAEIVLKSSEFCVDVHRFCLLFLSFKLQSLSFRVPLHWARWNVPWVQTEGGGVPMECTMCSRRSFWFNLPYSYSFTVHF